MSLKLKLIQDALTVAVNYPVFPTSGKIPAWSNKELDVEPGHGGFKIATQEPQRIRQLFSHAHATEIAVPMGSLSGLLCIDVDLYKVPELHDWLAEQEWLQRTLCHETRSGGRHYIFKHPGAMRFPSTLRPGVDVKAGGSGYICWPPTEGYRVFKNHPIMDFPTEVLTQAETIRRSNGSGQTYTGGEFSADDETLVSRIQDASDLYPSLRTLSYRLPTRKRPDGHPYSEAEQISLLTNIIDTSVAANSAHARHDDWLDRRSKIEHLVVTANAKRRGGVELPESMLSAISQGGFIAAPVASQTTVASAPRPVGPQREVTLEDVESSLTAIDDEYTTMTAESLRAKTMPPIEWLIEGMIPTGSTVSLGGTSNVGKTRWLAALVTGLAVGATQRMGLPPCQAASSLWIANEERTDDIERRIKAVVLQHGDKRSLPISVRGKDSGMMRLIALNEIGTPQIDTEGVARIVAQARKVNAKLIVLDPYITLSDAMDENSATSAAALTKAFILLSAATGAAVVHAHHTPKDRSKDHDWYRGDASAWRGSGAIYSSLDCGYTLSHWMPRNAEQRKAWKSRSLDLKLGRWIVLDTGKIREGEPMAPVYYEMVGQPMAKREGNPIGVCQLRQEHDAANVLLDSVADVMQASQLAERIGETLGVGIHRNFPEVHRKMKNEPLWPSAQRLYSRDFERLHVMFKQPVHWSGGTVELELDATRARRGRWSLIVNKHPEDE